MGRRDKAGQKVKEIDLRFAPFPHPRHRAIAE
jgi:hypothetical protein